MRVNHHDAIPKHHLPGLEHQTLAGSKDGMTSFEIWRQTIAPRAATPVHCHDCEEVITVLRGTAECRYDDRSVTVNAEESLLIPASVVHQILNAGDGDLYIMATLAMSPVQVKTADGAPMPLPWG
ncbi:MAG: cupin domain-containing protein [Gammaproteobacteria bacterium]